MCIIAAKAKGVAMPDDQTIENMWYGNSDGAGFMYAENGKVYIRKGFMEYSQFRKALDELAATHDMTQLPLVMHFRITTHGGTKPANCHPFPITDSVGILSKLETKCRVGVAHNGVIDITPRKGISDTMEYIASQLAPLSRAVPEFYKNKHLIEMIYNATGSRLAFLARDGSIYTVGDFIEDGGMLYSNTSYRYSRSWRDFNYSWLKSDISSREYESCMDDIDGSYTYKTIMWVTDGFLAGVDSDSMADEMFAVDPANNVYVYDYDKDALVLMPGASAWSCNGTTIRFEEDDENVMQELVYTPRVRYLGTWGGTPELPH